MNKRNKVKQLNRSADHRKSMIQNMVISLLRHERIESSVAKLKVARSFAEKIISRAKLHTEISNSSLDEKTKSQKKLHNYRYLSSRINDKELINKLLEDLSSRYAARIGGYTRIIRLVNRQSDNTEMGILELVDRKENHILKQEFKEKMDAIEAEKKAKKSQKKAPAAKGKVEAPAKAGKAKKK